MHIYRVLVSLAFGLTVLTAAYALGHISGGHFNPAVSIGLWVGARFEAKELAPYIISQIIGATLAALVLYLIVQGQAGQAGLAGLAGTGGFATNGYGDLSPGKYALSSVLLIEVVLTAGFLMVIMGATDKRAPASFAPIAIGLALTLIHLISIPVSNTSVNLARSRVCSPLCRHCSAQPVLGFLGCSDWCGDISCYGKS